MSTVKVAEEKRIASASFVWNWEEAKALDRALPELRQVLREAYGIDNLQMRFVNPWGGANHTEFSLAIELAKGTTTATVAALSKWLLDWGGDFLKGYRKKHKSAASAKQKPRSSKRKRNVSNGKRV